MKTALIVLTGLLCLAPIATAQEDRIDRMAREARELQRQQEERSAQGAEAWYRTPEGQRWLKTFAGRDGQDTSQESSYAYRGIPAEAIDTWSLAVGQCADSVGGKFSAFAPARGKVHMVGTAQQRYDFSACMSSQGLPLDDLR